MKTILTNVALKYKTGKICRVSSLNKNIAFAILDLKSAKIYLPNKNKHNAREKRGRSLFVRWVLSGTLSQIVTNPR